MKAYAITIRGNTVSEAGYEQLVESSKAVGNNFNINRFEAITPDYVDMTLEGQKIKWNYPWVGKEIDMASGLTKSAYKTKNPKARVACALSHYLLWKTCVNLSEPVLVLEHDAIFTQAVDFDINDAGFFIVGINNPLGATRKARDFYNTIVQNPKWIQPVPSIDNHDVPQGLAGNSAYILKPIGAQKMLDIVKQYGLWPNDALMCKQLLPRIGVTKKFYTTVQGLKSTTTQ
jgi:GR25 family glycosyltransferase involved in LPS biosynthesis